MSGTALIPVEGCWVRRASDPRRAGIVVGNRQSDNAIEVQVDWAPSGAAREWVSLADLQSALQSGWLVQDVPLSATRRPLGEGVVVGSRRLGGREQILVQLEKNGHSVWLPHENLVRLKDVRQRYVRQEVGIEDHASRFRLRLLAHALESWNQLTGALDRLDVDPLPHQIQLVHRILSSANYNWLIADDVGLGKTIEVGLLLAALNRRGQARRVLIVAPAGLTKQWQDEMKFKFGQTYRIYGRDFFINEPGHWKLEDHVIVSLDLAKRDEHMEKFRTAGGWDVVIFDEGHKLTRYASGERAQRFRLAEALRPQAQAFLLLSGTPHQGYADRFMALLELVRPDLRERIHTLESNPEIVSEMILRNRKSEVTDADGNFIFKGHEVHRVPVEPSAEMQRFQAVLRDYLRNGYSAGAAGGATGRAIGFVMTTYRKLASSSIAAIERALRLRRDRLLGPADDGAGSAAEDEGWTLDDLIEGGDEQERLEETLGRSARGQFFASELEYIRELIELAAAVRENDEKLDMFLNKVVEPLDRQGKKLLVFTEYRATQTYLVDALARRFPEAGPVLQINGSMKLEEKLDAIEVFNNGDARFLISTEAGGEGLNLHRACHVMVNYDLPWNPARLVQRIGRLYRYGQQLPVIVFNLHARDSFDNAAIGLMLDRVSQIVQDMAPVGGDFHDRLHAEILGDILDNLDLSSLLTRSTEMNLERSREQIEEAIERARRAKELQDEILSHVGGYDPAALRGTLGFSMQHVEAFVRAMLPLLGATIETELHRGGVLEVRLPEELKGGFAEFGQRTLVRLTTDRRLASQLRDVVLLDFETSFFQELIRRAKSQKFDGRYASIEVASGVPRGSLAAYMLHWQNDQGQPVAEEFITVFRDPQGRTMSNPPFVSQWLVTECGSAEVQRRNDPAARAESFRQMTAGADRLLADESSRFKHPNSLVHIAAADFVAGGI